MKIAKGLLGIVIWIALGFFVYCLCAGIGIVAYFVLHYIPWYSVVIGTTAGCGIVYLYFLEKTK